MIRKSGTQKTLEANGASVSTGNVAQADDANYAVGTDAPTGDGAGYAFCEFAFSGTFSVAPTENSSVDLFLQPLNFDGTNDAQPPENGTAFKGATYVGSFVLNNVTTAQYGFLPAILVPPEYAAWIQNNGGQTLSAGWTLKATPVAYKAA